MYTVLDVFVPINGLEAPIDHARFYLCRPPFFLWWFLEPNGGYVAGDGQGRKAVRGGEREIIHEYVFYPA